MEERQVTQHTTGLGTATWLNGTTASSLNAAYRDTGLARKDCIADSRDHRGDGRRWVSAEQAAAIVGVLKKLPEDLSVEQVQAAEAMMIGFAADHGPKGPATWPGICSR